MPDREAQLRELIESLRRLVTLLGRDPQAEPYSRHFHLCLATAEELLADDFAQSQLNELSGAVMHTFGGAGSFTEYHPWSDGKVLPWASDVDRAKRDVYDSAQSLRLI